MVIRNEKLEQNALQLAPAFLAFSQQVFVTWSFQLFCDIIIYTQTIVTALFDAKIGCDSGPPYCNTPQNQQPPYATVA